MEFPTTPLLKFHVGEEIFRRWAAATEREGALDLVLFATLTFTTICAAKQLQDINYETLVRS